MCRDGFIGVTSALKSKFTRLLASEGGYAGSVCGKGMGEDEASAIFIFLLTFEVSF